MVSAALGEKRNAREIRNSLDLDVSVRRVQQLLKQTPFLRYSRPERAPHLSRRHWEERLKWAEENLDWDHPNWRHVIFTDKKKLNLDGIDSL